MEEGGVQEESGAALKDPHIPFAAGLLRVAVGSALDTEQHGDLGKGKFLLYSVSVGKSIKLATFSGNGFSAKTFFVLYSSTSPLTSIWRCDC